MPLFLSILEGRSPRTARPLLATSDRGLIDLVRRELWHRLSSDAPEADSRPPTLGGSAPEERLAHD